jgi:hypothetical protein
MAAVATSVRSPDVSCSCLCRCSRHEIRERAEAAGMGARRTGPSPTFWDVLQVREARRRAHPVYAATSAMPSTASQRLVRAVHCGCTDMLQRFLRPLTCIIQVQTLARWLLCIGAHDGHAWGGAVMWMGCAARGQDALVLARTATTALSSLPLALPAFPLLESRAYASRAERVWVSGGVDEHHTRPGHLHGTTRSPASITHTHPPRLTQSGQHFSQKITRTRQP